MNTSYIGTLIIMIFITSFVGIIVTGIVVDDYVKTTRFHTEICQGTTANYTIKRSNECVQANIPTKIIKDNITYDVNLYYPPIDHWLVVCQSESGLIDWMNDIRKNTFTCFVDHVANGYTSYGIINKLNQQTLIGFAFGFTFSLIFFALSGTCVAYNIYHIIKYPQHKHQLNSTNSNPINNSTNNSTNGIIKESSIDIKIPIEDELQFKYNTYGQEHTQYLHDQQNKANNATKYGIYPSLDNF